MAEPSAKPASTRVSWVIKAPRQAVYQAFLDRDAVAAWLPPDNMTGQAYLRTTRRRQIPNHSLLPKYERLTRRENLRKYGHRPRQICRLDPSGKDR